MEENSSIEKTDYCYGQELLAYQYAEEAVKQKLKAPSTAKFPSSSEQMQQTVSIGNCSYKIDSWVDSQNSFGAMLRAKFSCTIVFDNEKVRYEDLKIE